MQQSRTPVDWLIAIVNILALLLGLAMCWLWIFDAAGRYMANDNDPSIRVGMSIGFAMAYLVWTSVVTTYLVLKKRPPTEVEASDGAPRRVRVLRVRRRAPAPAEAPAEMSDAEPPPIRIKPAETTPPATVTEEAYKASPPPIRVKTGVTAPEATPVLEPVLEDIDDDIDDAEVIAPPPPPAAVPLTDAAKADKPAHN